MSIIKNPLTIIKSGGEDKLAYRISNLGNYTYENNEITSLKNYAFYYDANLAEIRCGNVESIGNNTFMHCTQLITISFPSATSIGSDSFDYCSQLTAALFPSIISIGTNAFRECSRLASISFPLATNIGGYAFYRCMNLTAVSFPVVTIVGNNAFRECSRLTTVSFPSATIIDGQAFQQCSYLTSISFPLVTNIRSQAFQGCASLLSASFPSATIIGSGAFYGCNQLTSITLGNTSQVCSLSSADTIPASSSHHINIYVPINLIASYQTATNWSTLYNNGYISFLPIDGYLISVSNTNGTYTGDVAIANNGTATITLSANSGYELPSTITVTGASYTYNQSTGVVSLSNPTAEVNISCVCQQATPSGYSVSVSSINTSPYGYGNAYYSTDNGATWTEITTGGLLTSNATQIKFRVVTSNYAMEIVALTCQSLNVSIRSGLDDENIDSANITLTSNVSDVVVDFIDND